MTTLIALVSGLGWHVADLTRAAERLGINFHAAPFPQVTAFVGAGKRTIGAGGFELTGADGVLVRMMPPGSLEQVVFRMDALHRVSAAGIRVWNPPRAVEAAVDKYLTLAILDHAGLPVPSTWVGQSATEALDAFESLGSDVVIKPLFGSEGRGIVRVSDREIAWRTCHALERCGAVLYLQRTLRHPGHDLRVFVLQGRVLGAMRRFAPDHDWRTNVSQGGRAQACRLDPVAERIAVSAAQAIGAELLGVDLIEDLDTGQLVILEVNAVPGWRALARVTSVDVAAAILAALRDAGR
jgi:ribosomal protein S6--L-glutamate ligase